MKTNGEENKTLGVMKLPYIEVSGTTQHLLPESFSLEMPAGLNLLPYAHNTCALALSRGSFCPLLRDGSENVCVKMQLRIIVKANEIVINYTRSKEPEEVVKNACDL